MKKLLLIVLSLIMILSLSACGGSGDDSDKGGDSESKLEENLTAYEYYHDAIRKYNDKDSIDVEFDSGFKISSADFDFEMKMGGSVQQSGINVEKKEMIYDLYYDQLGGKDTIKGFYVDGYSYSEENGVKRKSEADSAKFAEFEDILNIHPVKFSNDMVESESVNDIPGGKELHMKLKTKAIDYITFGMLGGISNIVELMDFDGEMNLKSISLSATIDDEGEITDLSLAALYDVLGDGETGSFSVTLTEKFNQLGGVEMSFPTDLSDYKGVSN